MTNHQHRLEPPDFFEAIRLKAQERWELLEADPDLAGPWHQLFKQVQSPKHVVSELLQNADDAGATEASIQIENSEFVFSHNGRDFQEAEFASLCRFGYSNKRSLHTIGFRGIGFKSTFSLGDEVQLRTPSLSVAFCRKRFTEPVWINDAHSELTEISVVIKDSFRQNEIENNLKDWLTSSASLLFFDSIRSLRVGDKAVCWDTAENGPVPDSKWMVSSHEADRRFLVIRSKYKPFPPDAVEEIRQERMISDDDETVFPPSRVDIVLGMEGRLFVVLPTEVKTKLPFACNAPFIQDPGRSKIKDPATSPTNRWLLSRAGGLAAAAMMAWLRRIELSPSDRCMAYSLLPDVDRDDYLIEGTAATIADKAFENSIDNCDILLTEDETLVQSKKCFASPQQLLDIWSKEQVSKLFDEQSRPILSRHVSAEHKGKLNQWDLIGEIGKYQVLDVLEKVHLPRPKTWRQILSLWSYISDDVCKTSYSSTDRKGARIVPVQGSDLLCSADEVVRLGEKRLLQSDDDWQFLSEFLLVMNQNWPRFLAEQKRIADEVKDESLQKEWLAAKKILNSLGLDYASDASRVIKMVADKAFANESYPLEDCIRIAQIAAKLGATVSNDFSFVAQDGIRRTPEDTIVADLGGDFDQFVDDAWYDNHVLHSDYNVELKSCTRSEWEQWVASGKSKLLSFVPIEENSNKIHERSKIEQFLQTRGAHVWRYPYKYEKFVVQDWDFAPRHWFRWKSHANNDPIFWTRLVAVLLRLPKQFFANSESAKVLQIATTGSTQSITKDVVPSSWIVKLRELPCLLDTHGHPRKPLELLRRTPETEPLLDLELFVRAEDDNENTRPMLKLLGVGEKPTGPDRLLERLRALAGSDDVPVYEVQKWYQRLDQLYGNCSSSEQYSMRNAFGTESLILTKEKGWSSCKSVFLNSAEDDLPGAPTVHPSVSELSLWQKLGVKERPTVDLVISWLKTIPTGKKLDVDEAKRVRALLPRFPERVWNECQHWKNLGGEWVSITSLVHSLTMQSLVAWSHLFDSVKLQTADFRGVDVETCSNSPFVELPTLASQIQYRFNETIFGDRPAHEKPWLTAIGNGIARIKLDDDSEQQLVRELGIRLIKTRWQIVTGLESVPYINGVPAGTPRRTPCLWKDNLLFVEDRPIAQLFKAVTQELARAFNRNDIGDAIRACVERSTEFVEAYFEENFELMELEPISEDSEDAEIQANGPGPTSDLADAGSTTEPADSKESTSADIEPEPADEDGNPIDESQIIDNDPVDEPPVEDDASQPSPDQPKPKPPKPSRPPLIEAFATAAGFAKDGNGRFYHPDGSWIQRMDSTVFPWAQYSSNGELVQSYWTKEICLEREALEVDAARWNLCENHPGQYSFVLRSIDEKPQVLSGTRLLELKAEGSLSLFSSSYRLVIREKIRV